MTINCAHMQQEAPQHGEELIQSHWHIFSHSRQLKLSVLIPEDTLEDEGRHRDTTQDNFSFSPAASDQIIAAMCWHTMSTTIHYHYQCQWASFSLCVFVCDMFSAHIVDRE